jgi:hypothetical protein
MVNKSCCNMDIYKVFWEDWKYLPRNISDLISFFYRHFGADLLSNQKFDHRNI